MTAFAIGDTVRCIEPIGAAASYDLNTETTFIVRWANLGAIKIEGSELAFSAERFVVVAP